MKFKSHLKWFITLLILNTIFVAAFFPRESYEEFLPKKLDKIKFKSSSSDEALVIKFDEVSGTVKIAYNLDGQEGELKAKVDSENPSKIKYKETDDEGDKSTVATVTLEEQNSLAKILDLSKNLTISLANGGKPWLVDLSLDHWKINQEGQKNFEVVSTSKKGKSKTYGYDLKGNKITIVKISDGKHKLKPIVNGKELDKELYSTKDIDRKSMAIAVLGFKEIPAKIRAIMMAEILKQRL